MPDAIGQLIRRSRDSIMLSQDTCSRAQQTIESCRHRILVPMQGGSESEHPSPLEKRSIEKTLDGRLPESIDAKLYGGYGTNAICSGCDEKITAGDVEFETDQTDAITLRFHAECYRVWKTHDQSVSQPGGETRRPT
jgi:hypothetical protein